MLHVLDKINFELFLYAIYARARIAFNKYQTATNRKARWMFYKRYFLCGFVTTVKFAIPMGSMKPFTAVHSIRWAFERKLPMLARSAYIVSISVGSEQHKF